MSLHIQSFRQRGSCGSWSEAATSVLPRSGEVPKLADRGGDHLQCFNRCHQQGEAAGAPRGCQEAAGSVEGRTQMNTHIGYHINHIILLHCVECSLGVTDHLNLRCTWLLTALLKQWFSLYLIRFVSVSALQLMQSSSCLIHTPHPPPPSTQVPV